MSKKKQETKPKYEPCTEVQMVENFRICEEIMKENGWSWYDEDGKPLPPMEFLKLIDKICVAKLAREGK